MLVVALASESSLQIKLTLVDRGILKITNSGTLDHVTDGETLDGLVLGDAASAVEAADRLDVATSVLVATVVSSLGGLKI
jgi:hypothetical protein